MEHVTPSHAMEHIPLSTQQARGEETNATARVRAWGPEKRVARKPTLQPGLGPGAQRSAWQGNQRYSQGWGLGPREAQANIPAHSAATLVAVMQVGVLTWEDDETQTTASTEPAPMAGEAN